MAEQPMTDRKPFRWHILVFLAPAVIVYTAVMIVPLFATLNLALFTRGPEGEAFAGLPVHHPRLYRAQGARCRGRGLGPLVGHL